MAKIDKVLGSISPLYGMASGQGAFAHLRKISPLMHLIGETDTKAEKRRKRLAQEEKKQGGGTTPGAEPSVEPTMRKGGKVKKMAKGGKVRGCGIAKRGLTKGKMR